MKINYLALGFVLLCAFPLVRADAAPEKIQVTRDNFVSLALSIPSRVDAQSSLDYFIDKSSISRQLNNHRSIGGGGRAPDYNPPLVVPLSNYQFEALLRSLKIADVPAMSSAKIESQLPSQSLVLTLSDSKDIDQSYTVSSSDRHTSAAQRKLNDYLTELIRNKGLAEYVPAE